MRSFFILSECAETTWRYVDDYELHGYDAMPLLKGEKLESGPDNVKLEVTSSGKWPALLNNPLSWIIVSNELRSLFEKFAPEYCRFFSLGGCFTGAMVNENYWLLSFFRKINCMDREKSKFREIAGTISAVNRLVLDPSLIPENEHVFLFDRIGSNVIVDQVFVESLMQSNIVGVALIPIETSE